MQDDNQVTEDALRRALSRLGSGRTQNTRPTQASRKSQPTERRRFVKDGQVVVEHHALRPAAHGRASVSVRTVPQDEQDEIERLKQSVKREQRRWEEAERNLADAKNQIKAFETRAAHARIQITELTDDLRQHQEMIQSLKTELHKAHEQSAQAVQRSPRPVGRPRKERLPETHEAPSVEIEDMDEPQPVQWWIHH